MKYFFVFFFATCLALGEFLIINEVLQGHAPRIVTGPIGSTGATTGGAQWASSFVKVQAVMGTKKATNNTKHKRATIKNITTGRSGPMDHGG